MSTTHCAIITIGDELLIGQTIDTNSAWIAQQLNPLGVLVKRRIAVGDDRDDILRALEEARQQAQIILLTGGLGPTADDITKPLLCEYFGGKLIQNEAVLQHVHGFFAKRNRPVLESNTRQALVPDVCEVLFNAVGTAPGMLFRDKGQLIISLPGVPFEMQYIISTHVLDLIRREFTLSAITHRSLATSGEGESFVAERLKDFEKELPASIKLAYLPKLSIVKLRLTGIDVAAEEVEKKFIQLKSLLADIAVGEGDIELEHMVGQILQERGQTMAVAESCTGGLIASRITSVRGASAYFKGGLVPYSIESKIHVLRVAQTTIEKEGVVSEATVAEMAQRCREQFNSDFAVSVSGYLEKNDQDNSVWIGLASEGKIQTKRIIVPYDREKNSVLATNTALNLLRLFILSH